MDQKVIILLLLLLAAVFAYGIMKKATDETAHASNKYVKVTYWEDGEGNYKAHAHFAPNLDEVSAIHIHRQDEKGGIGHIIAWLATSNVWHNGPMQGKPNTNKPCCIMSKNKNNCTLQAPPGTPSVESVAGKEITFHIPAQHLYPECQAEQHLSEKETYLVVHGKHLTKHNPLDILHHSKFQ